MHRLHAIRSDVYVRHLGKGTTEAAEVTTAGGQGARGARDPIISPSGKSVAFYSEDTNVAPGQPRSGWFLRNLATGKVFRLANNAAGLPFTLSPQITAVANDRTVLFQSSATNVVPHDTNKVSDAFVAKF